MNGTHKSLPFSDRADLKCAYPRNEYHCQIPLTRGMIKMQALCPLHMGVHPTRNAAATAVIIPKILSQKILHSANATYDVAFLLLFSH